MVQWGLLLILLISGEAFAEGSRSLFPSTTPAGGARAAAGLAGGTYAGVLKGSQFVYVYAKAGEYIELGSSNVGVAATATQNDIFVYNPQSFGPKGNETIPGTANFSCSSQPGTGAITTRALELAGPNSADGSNTTPGGYAPCYYVAPSTGIYGVRFLVASGNGGSRNVLATVGPLNDSIAAWDVTVRATASDVNDINGRVFSYGWVANTGGNGASNRVWSDLYYVSVDGYRYKQTLRGIDPNFGVFYSNSMGFLDSGAPLYHDYRGSNQNVNATPLMNTAGITAQPAQYPLFFSDVSPTGTNAAEVATVLGALAIPATPPAPQLSNVSFAGNVGGNTSTVSSGGTYTFTTVNTQTYQIVIQRGAVAPGVDPNFPAGCVADFDPANICNRTITGIATTGTHNILWNGRDNSGFVFPAGSYSYQIMGRNGEIHFPMLDIEGNVNGGPTLQKLNGSQDSMVYFDDRGYRASNATAVGTLNANLCGGATIWTSVPAPDHSLLGIDSVATPTYRTWGGSNNDNSDCQRQSQYFGDSKGLDIWGYEKTQVFVNPIVIIPLPVGVIDVGTSAGVTSSVIAGGTAYGNFTFFNAGAGTATGVTYTAVLGNPGTPATCPAAVNFPLVPAGVTATYNPAPACTITFTGMPGTLTGGQSLNFSFNYVVAPTNPGPIPLTTTISAGNENCVTSCSPNTATAQTVVAKPIISVVKSAAPAAGSAVAIGDTITYTLTATIDSAPLTSVFTLTDVLGTGLSFGTVTNAGSFSCSGSLVCTLPVGTATGTYSVTYTATVNNAAGATVANNVTPTGGGGDNPPTCSPCSVSHNVPKPNVSVLKSGPATAVVGSSMTYTLTVTNSGNAATPGNVIVQDQLPAGVEATAASGAACAPLNSVGALLTCTVTGPLAAAPGPGNVATITITATAPATVPPGGSIVNYAATHPGGSGNPPTAPGAGCDTLTTSCSSIPTTIIAPTVSVAKTSNPATGTAVNPGQTITYTLTATVANAPLTSALVLTDTLSAGQTFGTVTSAGAYTPNTGGAPTLIFTLPSGTAPGTYAVSYTATVNANATGSVGNSVVPTGGTPPSNPPTCAPGACTTTHPLNPSASIVKTSNPASGTNVNPGQTITYTLTTTVANAPLTSNLVLTDTLSAGQTFGTVTSAGAYTPNTGGAPTLIFTLPSGTAPGTYAVSYTATVNANATGSVGNAVVPTGGTPPSNPPTCTTCTTTHPLNPSASIVKTSNPASGTNVNPGQTITYTLTTTVTNAPLTSNLVLTDTLSAGQTFGTVTSAGAYTPNTGGAPTLIFTLPSGTAPGTYAVSYTATVNANATGSVGNSVVPTGGTPPSNPPTCTTCTTTHPLNPTASIVKTSNPASGTNVNPGQTITYTLTTTVTNAPLTSALVLTDTLSAGQTFGTVTSAGAYTPNTGGAPTLIFTLPSGTVPGTYAVSYTATVNANATGSVGNAVVPTGGTPPSNPPTCAPGACTTTHPLNPTVSVVKTSNPASGTAVVAGQTITYTVTATVSNAALISPLVLTDTLSANQTFGSVTAAGAYSCTGSVQCTLPTGTAPGTYAVSYTATVNANATGSVGNSVVPTGGTPPSNPPTCAPGACTTTHPLDPTVSVTKASNPASGTAVNAGQTITYTLTATVANAPLTSALVLTDTLSAGQTFGTVTSAGAYTPNTGGAPTLIFTLPSGTVPGTYAVSYTATVNANATGSVGNAVVPTGGTPPSNPPTCTTCTTTHPLNPSASIVKTSNPASGTNVNPGQTITYTLTTTVTNAPLTSALVLTDTLSAGQTFGTVTSAGAYTPNTGGAPTLIFTLPSGTAPGTYAVSYTATVNANATGSVGNSVVPTGGTPPSNPPTCAPGACTTTHPLNPSASIVKTSNPASGTNVNPGQTITYTLTTTVANAPLTSNLVLTDTLSAGQTFGTVTSAGAYTPNTGGAPTLIFTLPSGTAPGTYAVSYTATVNANATGSVGNSVVPTGGTPPSNPPTCTTCTTTHPLNPTASIVKTSNPASGTNVNPGQTITYTLTTTVTNAPLTSNLVLTDTLSAGQTFGTVTSAGAYTPNTGGAPTLIFTLPSGTVPGTYAVSYTATVNANATGSVGNAVVPTGGTPPSNPPTCAPGACTTTHPLAANVTIAKTLTGESGSQAGVAEPGENLTYTITLTNTGGVDATGYNLSDAVPANTTFVSASNGGALAGSVVNWTNLTVPRQVGATPGTLVVTVTVQVAASIPAGVTSIANVAYQTGTTPPACPPAGPQCVVTPTAGSVTIAKTLTGENGSQAGVAEPGENLTYTITLTNTGGADVTGYNLSDVVPANTTFVSASNGGALAGSVVNWTNLTVLRQVGATPGTLAVTVTVQVVASIPAGVTSIANVAYQTGTTPPACPPAGPQCVVTPTAGSVTIAKTLTGESGSQAGVAEPGENLTYTITLTNTGGADVAGYNLSDNLPTNTTFVSASNGGALAGSVVNWTNLTVPRQVGATPGTLAVTVTVQVAASIPAGVTSIANVAYQTGTTPPACPPSGPQCVVTPTAGSVTVVKALAGENGTLSGIAEPGEQLTYTITLTNTGGAAANNVGITDHLDALTSFVSASNGGALSGGDVVWTGLTVPVGNPLVLTIVVQVAATIPPGTTQVANLAYVTGTTPPACPPSGPQCVVTPTVAQVTVTKALSGESIDTDGVAEPGELLTYTITVRNDGGTPTLGTLVNETVPQHTIFVSGTPSWTCPAGAPAGTACDALVNVPAHDGTSPGLVTLTFTVQVDDPLPAGVTSIANAVAVDDGDPPDCGALPNDPACVVLPTGNLRLTKTVASVTATGPATYRVNYLIEVVNLGGSSQNYTLTDTLGFPAAGVVFTGNAQVTTTGGTINPGLAGGAFPPANGTVVQLSAANLAITSGATHTYTVSVPIGVQPGAVQDGTCTGAPGHGLYNAAAVTGTFDLDSADCAPVSTDVPLIRLVKTVTLATDVNGNRYGDVGDVLGYTFTISNTGTVPLTSVQLFDPRVQSLQCDPVTLNGVSFRVIPGDELFRNVFDGPSGGGILDPGDSVECRGSYALTADDVARGRVINSATTTGTAPGGQTVSSVGTAIFTAFR